MRVFIDGDACSIDNVRRKFVKKSDTEIVTVVSIENCSHLRQRGETVVVDSSPQAADIEIFNRVRQGDMVITKDYGLASLVLGKKGRAMAPSGFVYTQKNIGLLLQQRYVNGIQRDTVTMRRKKKIPKRLSKLAA